ncbi:MAG: thioredoxin [Lachnospiraceae bacterium]
MEYKFTKQNFDAEVLKSDIPVLVDFYADWCGPCKMMAPVVEKLAEELAGKVKVGKLNVDDEPELAGQYRVVSIPTFLIFKDGEIKETCIGAMSAAQLTEKVKQVLA